MALSEKKIAKLVSVFDKQKADKGQFEQIWQEIAGFIGIETGDWNEENSTFKPFNASELYDNTPKESLDTFCNGIEGYAFGRQIAWFNYVPENDDFSKSSEAMKCLEATRHHNYKTLNSNNFYDEARLLTSTVVTFGTGIMWMEENTAKGKPFFKTLHNKSVFPMTNREGEIDTIIRVILLTKEDAIEEFGENALSETIKNNTTDPLKEYIFYQYVAPSSKFGIGEDVEGDAPYVSVFWQKGEKSSCKESRFEYKPFVCWRWQRSMSGAPWATESPGINQLPNFKMINSMGKDINLLSQYIARGLWKKTKGLKVNYQPAGVTTVNAGQDFGRVEAVGDLSWAAADRARYIDSIKRAFYVDFFLALTENVDRMKTATEAAGLQDEKSTIMASFFSRMANEFLEPMHEWLFWNELNAGRVEGFESIEKINQMVGKIATGKKLKIDFVSPLFLIQKRRVELEPMEEFLKTALSLAGAGFSEAAYKLDINKYLDKAAAILGVDTEILISTEKALKAKAKVDEAKAQLAQQQQQLADANSLADTAQKAGITNNGK